MMSSLSPSRRFFGVTGRPGAGKTTLLERIARQAVAEGIRCGGFLQLRGEMLGDRAVEYRVTHLTDRSAFPIARYDGSRGYVYHEDAFRRAEQWLEEDAGNAQVLIVDELGALEAAGRGHTPALQSVLLQHADVAVLASLRKRTLPVFLDRYSISRDRLIDLDTDAANAEVFINALFTELRLMTVPPAVK